jgi:hypothetical protein
MSQSLANIVVHLVFSTKEEPKASGRAVCLGLILPALVGTLFRPYRAAQAPLFAIAWGCALRASPQAFTLRAFGP